jgi:hypothetical protein
MNIRRFLTRKIASLRTEIPVWRFELLRRDPKTALFARLPPMEGAMPSARSDIVVFCGADKGYVKRFALPFAVSLAAASGSAAFHLHMFGEPDAEMRALAGRIGETLGDARFSMSHERCDLAGMTRRRQIMYFEAVRFARLLEIAGHADVPLLAMDIDVLFLKKVGDLEALCADADVAITLRPREYNPAKKVRAAVVYFAASGKARAFLRKAVARMLIGLFLGPEDEYPDQRALARTIDRCKDFRLKGLPESALSSESEDAIVFSGRGEVKEKILPEVFARRFAPRPSTESKIEQA